MNFKFSKAKTIVSIILGFLVFLILFLFFVGCIGKECLPQLGIELLISIAVAIFIYIIWSLLERR